MQGDRVALVRVGIEKPAEIDPATPSSVHGNPEFIPMLSVSVGKSCPTRSHRLMVLKVIPFQIGW